MPSKKQKSRGKKIDLSTVPPQSIRILEATIKDEFCNYSYEVTEGVGKGSRHKVSGKGIIDVDLGSALSKFNPHIAYIDDIFKHSGVAVRNIEQKQNHELTQNYECYGFKIKGSEENETISLMATKFVTEGGGRMEIATPFSPLTGSSSYKWYNELIEVSDKARKEVELYHNGKYTEVEDVPEEDPAQLELHVGQGDDELDLETGKVK